MSGTGVDAILVVGSDIFWQTSGNIYSVPTSSVLATPVLRATGVGNGVVMNMASDGNLLYSLIYDSAGVTSLWRTNMSDFTVTFAGQLPSVKGEYGARSLLLDSEAVYWSAYGGRFLGLYKSAK